MHRRPLVTLATAALLTVALSSCADNNGGAASTGSESNGGPASVKEFTMGVFNVPSSFYAGTAAGNFGKVGLKTTQIDSGPAALPLVKRGDLAGIIDASAPPVLIAGDKKIDVKIVWVTDKYDYRLVVNPSIKSAADLKGKKIAIVPGSILEYVLDKYLEKNGLKSSDVSKVDLPPESMPAALKTGQIDGGYVWEPNASNMISSGGVELATDSDIAVVIMSSEFVAKNPDSVQGLVCGLAKTQDAYKSNPDTAYQSVASEIKLEKSQIAQLMPAKNVLSSKEVVSQMKTGGNPTQLAMLFSDIGGWLHSHDRIQEAPTAADISKLFAPSFAQKAAAGKCP